MSTLPPVAEAIFTSDAPEATARAARAVGALLRPGDIVLIAGDVGTGKTTWVRAACEALGVADRVTSPSFTIGQVYAGPVPVAHVDLFRLETLAGEDPALLADYLTLERVAFVEWPGAGRAEVDPARVALELALSHEGGNRRRIEARGRAAPVDAMGSALAR